MATHRPASGAALIALASTSAVFVAIALTEYIATSPNARYRWVTVLALLLLLLGGLAWAVTALGDGAHRPMVPLVVGVLLSTGLLRLVGGEIPTRRLLNGALFAIYCMFTFYLAARIGLQAQGNTAGSSVSIADTAFDVMVFTVIQTRFGDAGHSEQRDYEVEYVASRHEWLSPPPTPSTILADSSRAATREVILLGVAVAIALLTLLAQAAKPLGLDRQTGALPSDRWWGAAAFAAMCAITFGAERAFARWRTKRGEPSRTDVALDLPSWYWVPPMLAGGAWLGTAVALSSGRMHVPGLACISAAIVLALTARSLVLTPISLQCREPRIGQRAVAGFTAVALAAVAFWLVAYGAWSGPKALRGEDLAPVVAVALLGNVLLFVSAGRALAWGLPNGRESEHVLARGNIMSYVAQDAAVYSTVFLVGVAIPLYAASRDLELRGSSLSVVASLVFLPGLINAVVWGVQNWVRAGREVRALAGRIPRAVLDTTGGDWVAACQRESERKALLLRHFNLQRVGVIALMVVGLSYLAGVLIER